ncbi:putative reverse transcriptase domain-containing protein [Tanacetum coccineum]|uniref:Reverse transcriptase domain-containing protein n=1 Tax=Tanacetum coccineum TaxID=301880 RepID=A0ABQ4X8I3_9ASTR
MALIRIRLRMYLEVTTALHQNFCGNDCSENRSPDAREKAYMIGWQDLDFDLYPRKENSEMLIYSIKIGHLQTSPFSIKRSYDYTVTSKLSIYFYWISVEFTLSSPLSDARNMGSRKELVEGTKCVLGGSQSQGYMGNAGNNQASGARVVNNVGNTGANQARVIRCYNCNGEGHIAKQADHVDAYDLDCDDEATVNAIFMENLSPVGSTNGDTVEPRYDSNILSEVPHYDTYHDTDVLNPSVQEMGYIENIVSNNKSYDELTSNNNVISYDDYMVSIGNNADNYVPPLVQNNDMILSVIEQTKSQVEKNRLHTIRIPAVAPSAEKRMRHSIAKNSLIRAHINSYGHPFNPPKFSFIVEIVLWLKQTLESSLVIHHPKRRPELQGLTSVHISSGLVLNQAASTSAKAPTKNDWDVLLQPIFDEYFKPLSVVSTPISAATLFPPDTVAASPSSTTIDKDAPS